ncbi:MAG: chorismate synthase [Candidatus Omnitrophica bacterium]|nr:chorismate synthase [Candidatus Omnitrophota bacterium]MBU4303287.1 chorismate synthase [Candidatus Omnitrophota bacterium]MBU4418903.1 chorismate synthase [Candidatus Omnitrophota bacterium]MBU4467756.1 chorismate synthase [Candidatus Omnitrophota bacterium]MCG2708029.1 chorismate synthase [Candidatus Omnitrophota bacterium]
MLRCLTAGESHGKGMVAILEGIPAGLKVDAAAINKELKRRQSGFGRGKRMQIENDRAEIISGLKNNLTLGSPVTLLIKNKDASIEKLHKVMAARPGHADLAGLLKYGFTDIREVLERASARSTVATVAIGALCKRLLNEFRIIITSKVLSVGGESTKQGIIAKIDEAIENKDTVGGIFEVVARNVPVGLGSYVQADRRLDSRLAAGIISIPGIKSFEVGLGAGYAVSFGSEVHDAIYHSKSRGYFRLTNNAGGIEGGISNGQEIVLRGCMKPISTLMNPLDSVNIHTKKSAKAAVERSDTCVVESAGVVAESATAFVLAEAFLEKFGADCLQDIKESYKNYLKRIR